MTAVRAVRVIGIDPGPTPGMVVLDIDPARLPNVGSSVIQCSRGVAPMLLDTLLSVQPRVRTIVGIEKFVLGRRSARSSTPKAGAATRDLLVELAAVFKRHYLSAPAHYAWFERNASTVKTWATAERLEAAGLIEATKGMRHARDAARHALYAVVHDGKIPDPLSKRSRA
jgi:hypothetical protein